MSCMALTRVDPPAAGQVGHPGTAVWRLRHKEVEPGPPPPTARPASLPPLRERPMKRPIAVGSVLALLALVPPVQAQMEIQSWGGTNFDFQKTGFAVCDEPCHIWKQTDYWAQTFFASSLASVGRLDLSLNIDNVLNSGASIFFAALVNGTTVGSFSFADGDPSGVYNLGWVFAPLSAVNYRVELRITSPDVPDGYGSTGLALDGSSWVRITDASAVPEPSTLILLGTGLIGLAGASFRWKRRGVAG